ncbi:MAG: GtrA family protein [Verrucomicrobiota bacterium]
MLHLLNPKISKKIQVFLYRYRFLLIYIVIGITSLVVELLCGYGLIMSGIHSLPAKGLGLAGGIFFAYWMNVRFNFKVPTVKRHTAFMYFCIISAGSAAINFAFNTQFMELGLTYGKARFLVASQFFLVAYMFHRRFSFADFKKVGVAIYANGIEDIKGIYEKIGEFPDFIHVDIIDHTFGELESDPKTYRMEVVRAYWPRKSVHVHIMSQKPSRWIREVAPFADTIYIHIEIEEDLGEMLSLIHSLGKHPGLCITMPTPAEKCRLYLDKFDTIMLLTIAEPGKSGQRLDMNVLARIEEINNWPERSRFSVCVDGGVNEKNVGMLNVESTVSGNSVLSHIQPFRQIMRLQTSSSYEKI